MQQVEAAAFDRDEMLERVGGDVELLTDVIEVFLEECTRMMQEIESALDGGDAKLLHSAAHSMAGALLNISAAPAASEAQQLELLGNEQRLADSAPVLQRLQHEIERLKQVLDSQTAG